MAVLRIVDVPPASADASLCLNRYFEELGARFVGGFDPALSEARTIDDFGPPDGAFVLAYQGSRPVGCGGFKRFSADTAYLKRMWIDPATRGQGLGRSLLRELEQRAVRLGYRKMCLETHRSLAEAQQLYRRSGYAEVAPFNAERYADHWFEKSLAD
ncbi:MAG: GNAT family N-acetyltransferase [Sphingomicrobium sp.]